MKKPCKLRIFIDLSGHDYWHRIQFEEMLSIMRRSISPYAILVDSSHQSDCILRIGGGPSLKDGIHSLKFPKKHSPPEFVWDMGDLPSGSFPGLYVSLPSYMFDSLRHKAFCLPYVCNELIRPFDMSDARYLYGYCGSTSSGLRSRLNPLLVDAHSKGEALVDIRKPIWDQMFDRSGLDAKQAYANVLRQSRFNLCPRGCVLAGAGSRLYETMQAARVPVIISDYITLPEGIDWDSCSVRIRERDISRIPRILNDYSPQWAKMAQNAQRVYSDHFSGEALLGELGYQLSSLIASRPAFLSRLTGKARIALGLLIVNWLQFRINIKRMRS